MYRWQTKQRWSILFTFGKDQQQGRVETAIAANKDLEIDQTKESRSVVSDLITLLPLVGNGACALYSRFVQEWRLRVYSRLNDDSAIAAYQATVEHRLSCEVCRGEDIEQGWFGVYCVVFSTVQRQFRRSSF